MTLTVIGELIHLFSLGLLGWAMFNLIHMPSAALLGTITLIGGLRILEFALPAAPDFLNPLVQILLGIIVGSKVTKESAKQLREMLLPILIIITWTLSIAFVLGGFLSRITYLEPDTAILASSIGGLPEMTVLALAIGAELPVIIAMQTFRMVTTVTLYPFIIRHWFNKDGNSQKSNKIQQPNGFRLLWQNLQSFTHKQTWQAKYAHIYASLPQKDKILLLLKRTAITLIIGSIGGMLFLHLGVPAGGMVGALLFVASASLLGIDILQPPSIAFAFVLVGVGINVSDNITPATLDTLSGKLLLIILGSTTLIILSSMLIAYLIHRITKWDYTTCFLGSAPSGFTVMTSMALSFDSDPFRISMLHLFRLLAIKVIVPFAFMFLA
jgi:membrane AbrB-like protein